MKRMKVLTVVGTRPEIIRLSNIIPLLDRYTDHVLVHTGQNYDYELNAVFFEELGVRQPDYFLAVDTSTLGRTMGEVLIKTEEVLLKEQPDAFLVLGDTNSAVALMMAKRMKVPSYHMEAGNRSFDANVPEEINRRMIDHLADFNLAYTEHARRHLLAEGLSSRYVYVSGSPMREVLSSRMQEIERSPVLDELGLERGRYFIVSVHREENVDHPDHLRKVLDCLQAVYARYQLPVIVSTHPRTHQRLQSLGLDDIKGDIRFLKPFGFFAYNRLQQCCCCAVSDSGTISEESAILGFPAVTLRQSMERPEAMDAGSITLTGLDPSVLLNAIELGIHEHLLYPEREIPDEYKVNNTALRVVKLILGTAGLSHRWQGMDDFSRYDWPQK